MKRIMTIISAGIIALLSFTSCDIEWADDSGTCDAYLTCYYAGGVLPVTVDRMYELDNTYLSDREIEKIFYDLMDGVMPGFTQATLEIDIYDSFDDYKRTRVFDFWWETTNILTGDGYYAWEEVIVK